MSPPAKKTSPQKEVLHEQQQHLDKQKDLKSKIDADVGVVDEIDTSSKKTEIVETDDIPALEVVPEPQATFEEYPEELIKDAIKIDKPVPSPQIVLEAVAKELESVSMNEVEKPTISQKKDLDEGITLKPETPIQKEEQKVPTSIPKDETLTQQSQIAVESETTSIDQRKDDEIRRDLELMSEEAPKKKKTKKVKKVKVGAVQEPAVSPKGEADLSLIGTVPLTSTETQPTQPVVIAETPEMLPKETKVEEKLEVNDIDPTPVEIKPETGIQIERVEQAEEQEKKPDKIQKAVSFSEKTTEFKESVVKSSTIRPEKHQKLSIQEQQEEAIAEIDVVKEQTSAIDIVATTSTEQIQQNQTVPTLDQIAEPVIETEPSLPEIASAEKVKVVKQEPVLNTETKVTETLPTSGDIQVLQQKQMSPDVDLTDLHKVQETKPEIITEQTTEILKDKHADEVVQKVVPVEEVLSQKSYLRWSLHEIFQLTKENPKYFRKFLSWLEFISLVELDNTVSKCCTRSPVNIFLNIL